MRTVLISGASSDIGLAVCRRYLAANWRIIAHFRTPRPELDKLAGPAMETWQADFVDTERLERDLRDRRVYFGKADAFVNLATTMPPCSFEAATASQILSTLAVNLLPGLLIMQAIAPAMVGRKWGRIVHASSIGVKFGGGADSFMYSLSKHSQEFIPRAALSWAEHGVFVNVVRIGVTATRAFAKYPAAHLQDRVAKIPARRAATTDEMAEFLYWLASESNGFVSGEVLSAAGGE
ncbi:MAG: SDR family oxidoreductase [Xanthobacteraceae bacterium]